MLLCDDHYRQLVRQQSAPFRRWKPCSARATLLSKDFLGSDFFRISEDATPVAADTDDVVDTSFGETRHPVRVRRAVTRRWVGVARISEQSETLLQEAMPNTLPNLAAPRWIPNICCWRWPTAAVVEPSQVSSRSRSMTSKRQIRVTRRARGQSPSRADRRVAAREDALSRAFVASMNSAILMSVQSIS